MHIEVTARHAHLGEAQQAYLQEKAEKLLKYFNRLLAIEVVADRRKHDWQVEILVSAEHKHDIVAVDEAETVEAAMDLCLAKVERQIRRYKERIQDHKGDVSQGGTGSQIGLSPIPDVLPTPPGEADGDEGSEGD